MMLIGFSGRARHGKTECCEAIKNYAHDQFKMVGIYDIGDMIRRMAIEQGRLPQVERKDMTEAQLKVLIALGKEKRAEDGNYWCKRALAEAKADNFQVALCPNIRLPQEAQSFKDAGGYIVRCTRLNQDGSPFISPDRDPNDITETALQFWPADYHITSVTGVDASFVRMQAVTLFRFLNGETQ